MRRWAVISDTDSTPKFLEPLGVQGSYLVIIWETFKRMWYPMLWGEADCKQHVNDSDCFSASKVSCIVLWDVSITFPSCTYVTSFSLIFISLCHLISFTTPFFLIYSLTCTSHFFFFLHPLSFLNAPLLLFCNPLPFLSFPFLFTLLACTDPRGSSPLSLSGMTAAGITNGVS